MVNVTTTKIDVVDHGRHGQLLQTRTHDLLSADTSTGLAQPDTGTRDHSRAEATSDQRRGTQPQQQSTPRTREKTRDKQGNRPCGKASTQQPLPARLAPQHSRVDRHFA